MFGKYSIGDEVGAGRSIIVRRRVIGSVLLSFLVVVSVNMLATATDLSGIVLGPNTVADIAQSAAPAVVFIEAFHTVNTAGIPGIGANPFGGLPFGFNLFFNGQHLTPDQADGKSDVAPKADSVPNPGGMSEKNSAQNKSGAANKDGNKDGPANKNGTGNGGPSAPGAAMAPGFNRAKMPVSQDTGSGFIIRPDGYILTNRHVIEDADRIEVTLQDRRKLPATIVGKDNVTDLAVIKIEGTELPTLKMGNSSDLAPGEFAIAIGNPLGFDHSVTFGIISAIGRTVQDIDKFRNINYIQTDAAINPGNSGGPLLNLKGEVIGVNTAISRKGQNIGFSIPVNLVRTVSDELITHGQIARPWVGLKMLEVDADMVKKLGLPDNTKGILVNDFVIGSPAKDTGLQIGDIIQKIDGREIDKAKQVKEYVESHKVGDVLHLLVLRNRNTQAIEVKIGDYQNAPKDPISPTFQYP